MAELTAPEIAIAIDVSSVEEAARLAHIAGRAGADAVKFGLQFVTAPGGGYEVASELAQANGLPWIADLKPHDIPHTVANTVSNLADYPYPPTAVTMHIHDMEEEELREIQNAAGPVEILGVTVLSTTSNRRLYEDHFGPIPEPPEGLPEGELRERMTQLEADMAAYRREVVLRRARHAARGGLSGVVASGQEVGAIKEDPETSGLLVLTPGIRLPDSAHHDQRHVLTPSEAAQLGSTILVVGRTVTAATNPSGALAAVRADAGRGRRG